MQFLAGKNIVLGITGGIAAYKSIYLCRLLLKEGAKVQVVMTESAQKFVTPLTFETFTHNAVLSDTFSNPLAHIELSQNADFVLIAPASANTLAHLTSGFATNLLQNIVLARKCPLILAPAMNTLMWENAATQRNISRLKNDGVIFLPPQEGDLACGAVGVGKMAEPDAILEHLIFHSSPKILNNKRVMVTAGATFEPIDSVRGLTNLSSGKMGYAIAKMASFAGAKVLLISGKTALTPPLHAQTVFVQSALEMEKAVFEAIQNTDIFISVAAVSDYRAKTVFKEKLKKEKRKLTRIELVENPDILAKVAALSHPPFCVGFAAESEDVLENAKAKRLKKNIPLIIANDIKEGFGGENNRIFLITPHTQTEYSGSKTFLSQQIIQTIAKHFHNEN